jgi:hypothetical protein
MKYSAGILHCLKFTVFAQKTKIMSNFFRFFMVLAVVVLAGCAAPRSADSAQPVTSANTAQGAEITADNGTEISSADIDPDELICRREVVTGTNFRRRVCMTRAERDTQREESQEEMLERRSAVRGLQ